jgi:hypothetical protein
VRAVDFSPTFEDGMPIWRNEGHCHLGEQNLAAKVGKGAHTDEGTGEGRNHMALHCCRGKRWGRGKSHMATDCSGRPLATQTPMAGAPGFRLVMGMPGTK